MLIPLYLNLTAEKWKEQCKNMTIEKICVGQYTYLNKDCHCMCPPERRGELCQEEETLEVDIFAQIEGILICTFICFYVFKYAFLYAFIRFNMYLKNS